MTLPVDEEESRRDRGYLFAGILLLACAAAARIYFSWLNRHGDNADFGVVALMAKHIAEGTNYPVFFYGLAYGGSLEAAAGALFLPFFGAGGFAVSLGTALCGFFAVVVAWRWARDMGGEGAGLAALALLVVGSEYFAYYSVRTVGGYALTISLAPAVIWLSCRCVCRELGGKPLPWSSFLGLGILAGIGWWTNQLILPALATAGALFLLTGLRAFTPRILLPGTAGFILGSLPLWIWNWRHDFATFRLTTAFQTGRLAQNLENFFSKKIIGVMGWEDLPARLDIVALALLGGAALILLAGGLLRARKQPCPVWIGSLAILLFVALQAILFSGTQFGRTEIARYLLPLVPVFAVAAAVASSWIASRIGFIGWVPVILLITLQWQTVPAIRGYGEMYEKRWGTVLNIDDFLDEREITSVFGPYRIYPLNFYLGERVAFVDPRGDRYPPYTTVAELSDRVAVMNDFGGIEAFINYAGGGTDTRHFPSPYREMAYNFQPPDDPVEEVPPEEIRAIVDSAGTPVLAPLTDGDFGTTWKSGTAAEEYLEITFRKPTAVSAFRMASPLENGYPEYWRIDRFLPGRKEWKTLLESTGVSFYFWSGPRPYWGGQYYRLEGRFPARTVSKLRIVRTHNGRGWPWETAELQLFTPVAGPSPPGEKESLPALLSLLEERGIARLYGDRWISAAVHRSTDGAVATPLESASFPADADPLPQAVSLAGDTALLVRSESAPLCRRALATRGISLRETAAGPWVLFDAKPGQPLGEGKAGEVWWAGFSCLAAGGDRE